MTEHPKKYYELSVKVKTLNEYYTKINNLENASSSAIHLKHSLLSINHQYYGNSF